jgi:ribosomal protein S1
VTDVAKAGSIPVSIQISAFIRAPISFADVVTVSDLAAGASVETVLAKKFKVGQRVSLVHQNGRFSLTGSVPVSHEVGSLVVVRYVKPVQGFGVTVQLDEKTFGMIELVELTDDVSANVMQ